jgi:site-specific recombinase XerD
MTLIAPTLQAFFTDRMTRQLQASPRTIASYRDTLRLLLGFAQETTGKPPSSLDWDELDEPLISSFLTHLEQDRHNSARTRNLRLTAIRSLFRYAALRHPEHAAVIQRVLSIPPKRFEKRAITFLIAEEAEVLIEAPDQARWEGRRDRALLTLAIQAGLRVSELIGLDRADIVLGTGAHVRCEGKGRKQRSVPLTAVAQEILTTWLEERSGLPQDPLFLHPHRQAVEPRRDRTPDDTHQDGSRAVPVIEGQETPPARAAAQLRHVAAASGCGHHRDRALARARRHSIHTALSARRPFDQGTRVGPCHPDHRRARAPQALGRGARLPRGAVTMPTIQPGGWSSSPPGAGGSVDGE